MTRVVDGKSRLSEELQADELLKMLGNGDVFDDIGRMGKAKERLLTAAQIYEFRDDKGNAKRCIEEANDLDPKLLELVKKAAKMLRKEITARKGLSASS